MRQVAHGVVYFPDQANEARVQELMLDYSSARRAAYQALQRGMKTNDARKSLKRNYRHLGQRAINDAVSEASKINQPKAIFGGRRLWERLQTGSLDKEDWLSARNNTLYSRGDRTKQGNPNLRIVGHELWINDLGNRGKWILGSLWLNRPIDLDCYETRIQWKDGQFKVTVSWEEGTPTPIWTTNPRFTGVIGLDINPSGIALVETNGDGNLTHHRWLETGRIPFASQGKRQYDVRALAIRVVEEAVKTGKALVLEKLKFKTKASGDWKGKRNKKFNRMRHNFLWAQMLEAIKIRASREGVEILEVNPAFTSKVGFLKYKDMYSLSGHAAAALVIARRGMGLREVVQVRVQRVKRGVVGKERVNLEGRSRRMALTSKAFSWMTRLYRVRLKPPGVTPPRLDSGGRFVGCTGPMSSVFPQGERAIPPITGQVGPSLKRDGGG